MGDMNKLSGGNFYVYKKEVDWSLLNQGLYIPLDIQIVFQDNIRKFIDRGEAKDIFLHLDGVSYKVRLVNQKIDELKFHGHKDILRILYSPKSSIAEKLRSIFAHTWAILCEQRRHQLTKKKIYCRIPDEENEFLALYTTEYADTYLAECITFSENEKVRNILVKEDEQQYEASVNYPFLDPTASVERVLQLAKMRKLNKAIGENLKLLYDNKCQICGDNFGKRYDTCITEAHHIDPFVVSLNNDAANQVIICPNHHRVIHKAEATFDRSRLLFVYSNGVEEKLTRNRHLVT